MSSAKPTGRLEERPTSALGLGECLSEDEYAYQGGPNFVEIEKIAYQKATMGVAANSIGSWTPSFSPI